MCRTFLVFRWWYAGILIICSIIIILQQPSYFYNSRRIEKMNHNSMPATNGTSFVITVSLYMNCIFQSESLNIIIFKHLPIRKEKCANWFEKSWWKCYWSCQYQNRGGQYACWRGICFQDIEKTSSQQYFQRLVSLPVLYFFSKL